MIIRVNQPAPRTRGGQKIKHMKQLLYIITLLIATTPGFSQQEEDTKVDTKTLFEPLTSNTTIVRRKSIVLEDGFSTNGHTFSAKIDPTYVETTNVSLSDNGTTTLSKSRWRWRTCSILTFAWIYGAIHCSRHLIFFLMLISMIRRLSDRLGLLRKSFGLTTR